MNTEMHVGRVGAMAVALGVGKVRRSATRLVGAAAVVAMAAVMPMSTASASTPPCADTTVTCALILGGTSAPTPDQTYVDIVKNQYIAPTHPGYIEYLPVTTPEELWPFTGVARIVGLAAGDPRIFAFGATAWPNEPLWKLSGLFDLTADQSLEAGAEDLDAAIAAHPNEHLVIYGLSQGAGVANVVKKRLAEQYPEGTDAPDIDFVLGGDPNLPNGGWATRFQGLYIPILNFTFNGPAATDTQFDTVEINRQYDGFADFPLYPINLVADLNAVMGIVYVHTNSFDVSLPDNPTTSPAYQGTHGDTSYYFFESQDLPLFEPLRRLGVPEKLIDVVEPVVKVIVDTGYDRSIPPWEPTPARLIPPLHPEAVAGDLVNAVGEGITNAANLIGARAPRSPARVVSADLDVTEPERPAGRGATTMTNRLNGSISTLFSSRSGGADDSDTVTPGATHKTPVRDALKGLSSEVKAVVTKVSDGIKKALAGDNDESP